ncbi:5,6-dimethylbenzimidazole synthase [bacterium]|nr:5,6-dimethylbenzimidazole synthase [bacterium]
MTTSNNDNHTGQNAYSDDEKKAIYRAIFERRDMRHFVNGKVKEETLNTILHAAHAAPSVGYMQPWRFIRITKPELRQALHTDVEQERIKTAEVLNEREDEFMRLKVEGINDCAELLVVALMDQREPYIFGRRTLPDMDLASAACAIQNMWLAARAEGLGMGWVSLFNPDDVRQLLNMPKDSLPIAILCLGPVDKFYDKPMLETEGWDSKRPLHDLIMNNEWQP